MASEILGLFTTPEQYNMMQQQGAQNRALQFAQLSPFEKANYGIYQGAGQLAGATAGLFGVQDPQLRMISQRQMLSKEIDPSDPESILRAAQKAAQLNDQPFAFSLANAARKMQSEMALAQQRGRIDVPDKIQAGREINKLVLQRENLLAQGNAATSPQVKALDAEISSLQRVARGEKIPDIIEISNRRAELQGEIDTLTAQQRDNPTAENAQKILTAKRQLEGLPLPGDKASTEVARDAQIEAIDRQLASPELSTQERTNLEDRRNRLLGAKDEKQLEQERLLVAAGYTPGTPDYIAKMRQFVESEITGRGKGKGTQVDIGGIRVDTGKAGEAAGKKLGEELIDVKGKQAAIDSIRDAKALLGPNGEGVYAGAYGPTKQFVAKFTGVGSTEKAARTEEFLAYIGETVVPRLKEFGGNDSEQELAYLNKITGGDITMEPKALVRILETAERKIQRGIDRLRKQAETGETKKPLTSLLPRAGDNTNRPSEPAMVMPGSTTPAPAPAAPKAAAPRAPAAAPTSPTAKTPSDTPKATKRWNPQTRKLEVIR
jgi:hypothetical protein